LVKYAGPAEDLSFLAPLSCGYLTGAATVLNVLKPRPTSSIAILGLGAVGFSALMAAKAEGVKTIVAVDIIDWRLDLAKSFGATHTILGNDGRNLSIDQAVHEKFPNGVDYIVDTTGLVKMLNGAVKALAHSGTLAIVGTPQHENLSIDGLDMLVHCKNIMGVTGGYSDPQEVSDHRDSWGGDNADRPHSSFHVWLKCTRMDRSRSRSYPKHIQPRSLMKRFRT
jgi:Zn-dependent alcohol dehydrogenase